MLRSEKSNKDKKSSQSIQSFFLVNNDANAGNAIGAICNNDVCSVPVASQSLDTSSVPQSVSFTSSTAIGELIPEENAQDFHSVSESICDTDSARIVYLLGEASRKGFVNSFIITFLSESLADILREKGYDEKTVYWATQFVRCSFLVYQGGSIPLALLAPTLSYALKSAGVDDHYANIATNSVVLSASLLLNPLSWCEIPVAVTASVTSSAIGSQLTHSIYQYAKHRFFAEPASSVAGQRVHHANPTNRLSFTAE